MNQESLKAELAALTRQKAAMSALVDPLRAERDAVVAQIAPLEAKAAQIADKIKVHLPRMAQIDQRMSEIAKKLGHPRVGGLPERLGG